ncbi:MAG: glycosyltransferase family 87 protein [Candidatus Dormibacteraceae bacterium]
MTPRRVTPLLYAAAVGFLWPLAAIEVVGAASAQIHKPYRSDFALYYGVSTIGLQSGFAHIYDEALRIPVWARLGAILGGPLQAYPVIQPPTVALLTTPLALLPVQVAYGIWLCLLAASILLAVGLAAPARPRLRAVHGLALLALLPVGLGLAVGQAVFLVFGAVLLSWWLLSRRQDVAAGLVLVLILLKPQEAALVPLALLLTGRRRAFVTWAAGAVAVLAAALFAIGPAGAAAYIVRLGEVSQHPLLWASVPHLSVPGLVGGGIAGTVASALVVACALFAIWQHRDRGIELPLAIAIVGSVAATPYLHEPDTVMLVAAGWLFLRSSPPAWGIAYLVVGYVFIDLGQAPAIGWAPLVVLEVVWLAAMAVWRPQAAASSQRSAATA